MGSDIVIYLGLSFLIVHEMDAVHRSEWKMFIGLQKLSSEIGMAIFNLLHIPLFLFIFYGLIGSNISFRNHLIFALNVFFIVHFFLHLAFIKHQYNQFKSTFSWFIIGWLFLLGVIGLRV